VRIAGTSTDIGRDALASACAAFASPDAEGQRHQVILAATAHVAPFVKAGMLDEAEATEAVRDACTESGRTPHDGEIESALADAIAYMQPYAPDPLLDWSATPPADAVYDPNWRSMLTLSEKGKILPLLRNARLFFIKDEAWQDVLFWNAFAGKAYFAKPPPWHVGSFEPRRISDHDGSDAAVWLQGAGCMMTSKAAYEALMVASRDRQIHPVCDYLIGLKWDGAQRIDSWLIDHLGAEDTALNRAFARCWLIAAVARIFIPGCKVDTILILEGEQGIRKSSALRTLARLPEWFSDTMPELSNKDAMIQLIGNWIIEFAELDTFSRAETSRAKAFMSKAYDDFRKPYGFDNDKYQRSCIFAGTINPGGTGYLIDETGARRFWPVTCAVGWESGRRIDLGALERAVDQLWAEAVAAFRAGEKWYLDSTALEQQQQTITNDRFLTDPWQAPIEEHLADRVLVSSRELLARAMHLTDDKQDMRAMKRVGAIMRLLDWERCKVKVDGVAVQCYASPVLPRAANGRRIVAADYLLAGSNRNAAEETGSNRSADLKNLLDSIR
jgi:predicted P-loop ATPase